MNFLNEINSLEKQIIELKQKQLQEIEKQKLINSSVEIDRYSTLAKTAFILKRFAVTERSTLHYKIYYSDGIFENCVDDINFRIVSHTDVTDRLARGKVSKMVDIFNSGYNSRY